MNKIFVVAVAMLSISTAFGASLINPRFIQIRANGYGYDQNFEPIRVSLPTLTIHASKGFMIVGHISKAANDVCRRMTSGSFTLTFVFNNVVALGDLGTVPPVQGYCKQNFLYPQPGPGPLPKPQPFPDPAPFAETQLFPQYN